MKFKILQFVCLAVLTAECLLSGFIMPFSAHADTTAEMDALIRKYSQDCAVLVCTQDDEILYQYQPDKNITGASLIKLPYAVFACQQLMAGVHDLDETITYTSSWYHGGSGIIRKNGYGKTYTIRQLLDYSLRYSDNVAYDMLVSLFGIAGFNTMVDSWGYSVHIATPSPRFPPVSASFMTIAMLTMESHKADGECWAVCWNALNQSQVALTRDALSSAGYEIAVKYGNVQNVYHEVSYIASDTPYVLAILTTVTNYTPNQTFFKNIAIYADKLVSEFYADVDTNTDTLIQALGDVNQDAAINAEDAALVLVISALFGAGDLPGLLPTQEFAADVNQDQQIDAADAAIILQYV
ncbi:MAG: serine hydrolase, partial [Oscillospiraceae bacterium]|nr:serine hydrolase [Oscillospiraceae bacterium]